MANDGLPGPRGARAQVRHLRRLLREPAPVLDELGRRYGPVFALGARPGRLLIVGDPGALAGIFARPSADFRWGHPFNVLGFVVGRTSLIVSDGEDHRRRRRAVTPGFARRRLEAWTPMIVEEADAAVEAALAAAASARAATPIDLYPIGRHLVLRVAVRSLFGERLAARADEIDELFHSQQAYLESPAIRQIPHPLPGTRRSRVRADRRRLDAIIDTEIAWHRRRPDAGADTEAGDVLAALVASGEVSDTEIRDQVVTLVGAGFDTTAATLAWALWRATLRPGLWPLLRDEADRVLGPPDAPPDTSPGLVGRLDLAGRVVRETLRLHPAGLVSPRQVATDDLVIGGRPVRRGTMLLWSAYLAGRDATTWPEPLAFDPDRFVAMTDAQRADADRAWVPFGGGARTCIGFALAQMELTIALARLAQRLDLTPDGTVVPPPYGMVVNRPTGGAPMTVRRRAPRPA